MKAQVIEAIKNNDSSPKQKFADLFDFYRKHPHSTFTMNRHFNAAGYSPERLKTLIYEVKKVYGIADKELHSAKKKKPVIVLTGEQRLTALNFDADIEVLKQEAVDLTEFSKLDELLPAALPSFTKGLPGSNEMKAWLKENEVDHNFTKKADLKNLIEATHAKQTEDAYSEAISNLNIAQQQLLDAEMAVKNAAQTAFNEAPDDVKTGIKLRDEFPFLDEKDCPDKFKILVADKMTAYHAYRSSREEIKDALTAGMSNEELFVMAKTAVENFELNLEIYDELNYYKEHGEILGKHQIFADEMLQKKVDALSGANLVKRQSTLRANISRDSKKLAENKVAADKLEAFEAKLNEYKAELELVDKRLANDKA